MYFIICDQNSVHVQCKNLTNLSALDHSVFRILDSRFWYLAAFYLAAFSWSVVCAKFFP